MQDQRIQGITQAVQDYFDGLYNGDVELLRRAFHPQADVVGRFKGRFGRLSLEQFLKSVQKAPVPARNGEAYDMHLESLDISGEVAVAKVRDLYMGLRFTDYLVLHQTKEGWRIIHKAYRHE